MTGERRVGTGRFLAAFFVGWGTVVISCLGMTDLTVFGRGAVSARRARNLALDAAASMGNT